MTADQRISTTTGLVLGLIVVTASMASAQQPVHLLERGVHRGHRAGDRAEDRADVPARLPMRPEGGREGDVHPQPARRRLETATGSATISRISTTKDKHRLVIATPYSPTRRWSEQDDAYLQNIVDDRSSSSSAATNVKAFWLAGHSQGGMTSSRIVCTDFFKTRVDGFLSLSGGRLGGAPGRRRKPAGRARRAETDAAAAAAAPPATAQPAEPSCDFSHIFATGQHEIVSLPATSAWAQKFGCGARVKREDVVDDTAGLVYDGSRQNPPSKSWGRLPRPGHAEVFVYPNCRDGRVVADVMRVDKGHTEGLEPKRHRGTGQADAVRDAVDESSSRALLGAEHG